MQQTLERLSGFARNEIRALKATIDEDQKKLIRESIYGSFDQKDFYSIITGHSNSENSLLLIRACAPVVYPILHVSTLKVSVETWAKKTLALVFDEDDYNSIVRLFISPLEILFKRATHTEKENILSYLCDETNNLMRFEPANWIEYEYCQKC